MLKTALTAALLAITALPAAAQYVQIPVPAVPGVTVPLAPGIAIPQPVQGGRGRDHWQHCEQLHHAEHQLERAIDRARYDAREELEERLSRVRQEQEEQCRRD
jgi:hypothetical protein